MEVWFRWFSFSNRWWLQVPAVSFRECTSKKWEANLKKTPRTHRAKYPVPRSCYGWRIGWLLILWQATNAAQPPFFPKFGWKLICYKTWGLHGILGCRHGTQILGALVWSKILKRWKMGIGLHGLVELWHLWAKLSGWVESSIDEEFLQKSGPDK